MHELEMVRVDDAGQQHGFLRVLITLKDQAGKRFGAGFLVRNIYGDATNKAFKRLIPLRIKETREVDFTTA